MEQSRLYRSNSNSVIAGVCGGLGDYLNTDPILFRVLFAVAFFVGGSGLLVYIILWIAIPVERISYNNQSKTDNMSEENSNFEILEENKEPQKEQQKNNSNLWGGLILITLGVMFLIDRFVPRIDFGDLWPVILIVIGGILISKSYNKQKNQ